jgi:hypothetical protein
MHINWLQKKSSPLALIALGLLCAIPHAKGDWTPGNIFPAKMTKLYLADAIHGATPRGAPGAFNMLAASRLPDFSSQGADDSLLVDETFTYANEAAAAAFSAFVSDQIAPIKWIHLRDQSVTFTFSQNTVLNLTNFVLIGGTLTLQGTTGTMVTINVQNRFSLLQSSKIILSGGLQPSDVVFNILGRQPDVIIRGGSSLTGTIQAPHRTVMIRNHSTVFGFVTAKRILLKGSSDVTPPPVVSP